MRDISEVKFMAALDRLGIKYRGIFGYVTMPDGRNLSRHDGGITFREQLAYLTRELKTN